MKTGNKSCLRKLLDALYALVLAINRDRTKQIGSLV